MFKIRYGGMQQSLQLIRRQFHMNKLLFDKVQLQYKNVENEQLKHSLEKFESKIIYNTYVNRVTVQTSFFKRRKMEEAMKEEELEKQSVEPLPIILKYLSENNHEDDAFEKSEPTPVHFPFSTPSNSSVFSNASYQTPKDIIENITDRTAKEVEERWHTIKSYGYSNWMVDYENYEGDDEETSGSIDQWKINYGTPDPNASISNVPCGGCGALLHCKDTSIPGYIPSEIFKNSHRKGSVPLKGLICQRCHFLNHYNLALQVRVSAEDYPKVLETIKEKQALVLLLVDLLDFPCSVWPTLTDIIGTKNQIVLVGNKIDLLSQDEEGYVDRIRQTFAKNVRDMLGTKAAANIVHTALISAKTGWGVEELITKIHKIWATRGDVYIVGCTNVGKSSLFNCLLQSDFCKVKAVDLVQRATTSIWPGTTLNLLKFPILRPAGWKLHVRAKRLMSLSRLKVKEEQLQKMQLRETRDPKYAALIGHLERTFTPGVTSKLTDPFTLKNCRTDLGGVGMGLDEKDPDFAASKWCYDTPGVVQPDQMIHLFTAEELMLVLPKMLIRPQTFNVRTGQTLFIAGIARLDCISGKLPIKFTVFCANDLPITLCYTEDAEALYQEFLGTEAFKVPCGSSERLKQWPGLKAGPLLLKVSAEHVEKSAADVVLSSAGWVAITGQPGSEISLLAWTPEGQGIFLRKPLLPFAVALRGKKVRHSPKYFSDRLYIPK